MAGAILIALALLLSAILPIFIGKVYAAPSAADLQKQVSAAQKSKNEAKKQLDNIKTQTANAAGEVKKLDGQITAAEKQIKTVETRIAESDRKIAQAQAELEAAQTRCDEYDEEFKTRARIMYENGTSSYLEVIFGSQSFGDFITRVEMIKQIIDYDNGILQKLAEAKTQIANAKATLESERAAQEASREELSERKEELDTRLAAKEAALKQLEKDQKAFQAAYDNSQKAEAKALADLKKALAKSGDNAKYTGGKFAWPLPGYYTITSPYGYRNHPILKSKKFHSGIDIGASYGANVTAAADGTVVTSAYNKGGFGYYIVVSHGSGLSSLYAHNSKLLVNVGDKVTRGQTIAKAGSTGLSTGNHLHFSVLINGNYTDPMAYLK